MVDIVVLYYVYVEFEEVWGVVKVFEKYCELFFLIYWIYDWFKKVIWILEFWSFVLDLGVNFCIFFVWLGS